MKINLLFFCSDGMICRMLMVLNNCIAFVDVNLSTAAGSSVFAYNHVRVGVNLVRGASSSWNVILKMPCMFVCANGSMF